MNPEQLFQQLTAAINSVPSQSVPVYPGGERAPEPWQQSLGDALIAGGAAAANNFNGGGALSDITLGVAAGNKVYNKRQDKSKKEEYDRARRAVNQQHKAKKLEIDNIKKLYDAALQKSKHDLGVSREGRSARHAENRDARAAAVEARAAEDHKRSLERPDTTKFNQRAKVEDFVARYRRDRNKDVYSDEERAAAEEDVRVYRESLDRRLRGEGPTRQNKSDRSSTSPFKFKSKDKAGFQKEFDALPSGAMFINPSDGKIMRKR